MSEFVKGMELELGIAKRYAAEDAADDIGDPDWDDVDFMAKGLIAALQEINRLTGSAVARDPSSPEPASLGLAARYFSSLTLAAGAGSASAEVLEDAFRSGAEWERCGAKSVPSWFPATAESAPPTSPIIDQPPPAESSAPPTWPAVIAVLSRNAGAVAYRDLIADMRERDALGRARYGVALAAGNGRDHLVDAYQELLDGIAYLATDLLERGITLADASSMDPVNVAFRTTISIAVRIRDQIFSRLEGR